MSDLVKRYAMAYDNEEDRHDLEPHPAGEWVLHSEAKDRIEALEAELQDRRRERDHANDCADAAINRTKTLMAALNEIIREADSRNGAIDIARRALHGEGEG